MSDGISPNKLNDLTKVYLEKIAAVKSQEVEKDIARWSEPPNKPIDVTTESKDPTARKPKAPQFNAVKELVQKSPYMKPALQQRNEEFEDLREVIDKPETEKEAEKKVTEKKVTNKVEINPKLKEAISKLGGELISVKENVGSTVVDHGETPADHGPTDNQVKAKEKRSGMLKRQILIKKMQALRSGGDTSSITASYDPIEGAVEYFYEEGINEEGFDQILEEIGLEEFVDFVDGGGAIDLNEERAARKASVRAKKYDVVKKEVDTADAARKKAKKGEYAPSYAKKETDVTVYDDKPAAKKKAPSGMKKAVARKKEVLKQPVKKVAPKPVAKKVVKAVAKVKKTQPVKKPSKSRLRDKIKSAYKAGIERHKAARERGRVPEKRAKEFGKGFASGVKDTVKFAKKAKKAVVGEEVGVSSSAKMKEAQKEAELKKKEADAVKKVKKEEYTVTAADKKGNTPAWQGYKAKKKNVKTGKPLYKKADHVEEEKKALHKLKMYRQAGNLARKGDPESMKKQTKIVSVLNKETEKGYKKAALDKLRDGGSPKHQTEDKAFDNVVGKLRKKYGKDAVLTKDSPKPKAQPRPKANPQKPLTAAEKAQREVDARYGRTPWNPKGSLGT